MQSRHGVRAALAGVLLALVLDPMGGRHPGEVPTPPRPAPGYHHLGATTDGTWSGVTGRLTVRGTGVRQGTFDFVATRFMAKASTPAGVKWLEAGWAETGWSGGGRQRVYTFDTNSNQWTFYDQYPVSDGDQIWIDLSTSQTGPTPVWAAWLWWRDAWHLLTEQALPITDHATIEEYVEVYVDPERGGGYHVPPIEVDNVQLTQDPTGGTRYWTQAVPSAPGVSADGYCLNWQTPYDTWNAGDC